MKTALQKHKELELFVSNKIAKAIKARGVKSEHRSDLVIKVKDDQMFNLDGGRYLTEITEDELIDDGGYSYHHSVLTLEQLCEIADNLK